MAAQRGRAMSTRRVAWLLGDSLLVTLARRVAGRVSLRGSLSVTRGAPAGCRVASPRGALGHCSRGRGARRPGVARLLR
eukprot:2101538-Pyramimonas_sp.AAC.2